MGLAVFPPAQLVAMGALPPDHSSEAMAVALAQLMRMAHYQQRLLRELPYLWLPPDAHKPQRFSLRRRRAHRSNVSPATRRRSRLLRRCRRRGRFRLRARWLPASVPPAPAPAEGRRAASSSDWSARSLTV